MQVLKHRSAATTLGIVAFAVSFLLWPYTKSTPMIRDAPTVQSQICSVQLYPQPECIVGSAPSLSPGGGLRWLIANLRTDVELSRSSDYEWIAGYRYDSNDWDGYFNPVIALLAASMSAGVVYGISVVRSHDK